MSRISRLFQHHRSAVGFSLLLGIIATSGAYFAHIIDSMVFFKYIGEAFWVDAECIFITVSEVLVKALLLPVGMELAVEWCFFMMSRTFTLVTTWCGYRFSGSGYNYCKLCARVWMASMWYFDILNQ